LYRVTYSAPKRIKAAFYRSGTGREPVREWLKKMSKEDRKAIGEDIATAEFGWPVGMPICRKMPSHKDLWEVRSDISSNRIARVLFTVVDDQMILLHGFIKKTEKTEQRELALAAKRRKELEK
jgi:phage-related protein